MCIKVEVSLHDKLGHSNIIQLTSNNTTKGKTKTLCEKYCQEYQLLNDSAAPFKHIHYIQKKT